MFSIILILALTSLPYLLDLFVLSDKESTDDEFIPDGR